MPLRWAALLLDDSAKVRLPCPRIREGLLGTEFTRDAIRAACLCVFLACGKTIDRRVHGISHAFTCSLRSAPH